MTRTIWAEAGGASSQMKRRLVAAAFNGCIELMRGPLPFFERDIGMREADTNKERHNTRDGFEFADFDIVVSCAGPSRDQ